MQKPLIFILLVIVIVLGYLFIKKDRGEAPEYIAPEVSEELPTDREEESEIDGLVPIEKSISEENEIYKIDAKYPSFGFNNIDSEISSFVQKQVATFKSENSESYPGQSAKYLLNTKYRVEVTDSLSVIMTIETYTGGAHGNLFIKTFVYSDVAERMSIGSFFSPGSNYLTKLSEISRVKLGEKSEDVWFDEGTEPISSNFEAFYISEEGNLNIIFQPYQVGPWVMGTPEISIGFDELKEVLNEDYR